MATEAGHSGPHRQPAEEWRVSPSPAAGLPFPPHGPPSASEVRRCHFWSLQQPILSSPAAHSKGSSRESTPTEPMPSVAWA